MDVSHHRRRRRLVSPAALACYGLAAAALTTGGAWLNVELGSDGNAVVPIAIIAPAALGFGGAGVIVGRYSARPPGGPPRPAPPPRPALTRATVTVVVPALNPRSDLCSIPGTVPSSDTGEV